VTESELKQVALRVLGGIAPEADLEALDPRADLRETLDLDSMDFLNFVVGLHDATGVEVPESDYGALSTLTGCVEYLAVRSGKPQPGAR
jgi:acyl carrier protein